MKGKERHFSAIGRRYAALCSHPEGMAGKLVLSLMDRLHRPFASWLLPRVPFSSPVLDIGSGSGYLPMRILRRDRKAEVTLLDPSSASLEFSRHRLGRYGERASFVCGSAEALPFPPSSFSAAVMSDAIYYVDMEKAFAEAWRILVPGGFLVVAVEATDSGGTPSYLSGIAAIRGAEDIMKALCRQGFRIVRSDAGRTAWACIVAQKPMC